MRRIATLMVVGMVALFIGVGCATTDKCCGKCKKADATAIGCADCKAAGKCKKTDASAPGCAGCKNAPAPTK